jgi:hypothetical protein
MQKAQMTTDPATPPSSAGLLDCLAEMAEGVRRDLVENPEANVIQFVVGSLFLIALMKIAEFYMRWKAGVLPARRTRVAHPSSDALASPAPSVHPNLHSCDPAPEHPAPEHPALEHRGGARPDGDHRHAASNPGDGSPVAATMPVQPVAATAPQAPIFRTMSPAACPVPRRASPSCRPTVGLHRLVRSPPAARNFLRVPARAAFLCL